MPRSKVHKIHHVRRLCFASHGVCVHYSRYDDVSNGRYRAHDTAAWNESMRDNFNGARVRVRIVLNVWKKSFIRHTRSCVCVCTRRNGWRIWANSHSSTCTHTHTQAHMLVVMRDARFRPERARCAGGHFCERLIRITI